MKRKTVFGWLASGLLAGAPVLAASPLATGTWEGSVTQPDGTVEPVTFEVSEEQGQLRVTMSENGSRVFSSDASLEEDGELVFEWRSGDVVLDCALEPEAGGGYEGSCGDLRVAMGPPEG